MLITIIILIVLLRNANRRIEDLEFENTKNERRFNDAMSDLREERYLRCVSDKKEKEIETLKEEIEALKEELAATKELQNSYFKKSKEQEALYRTLQNAVMNRFGIRYDELLMMVNKEE